MLKVQYYKMKVLEIADRQVVDYTFAIQFTQLTFEVSKSWSATQQEAEKLYVDSVFLKNTKTSGLFLPLAVTEYFPESADEPLQWPT